MKLQENYPNDIKVITQNVDDLFEKVNSKDVIHLHGFMTNIYCEDCGYKENIKYKEQKDMLRPDVVFFGEVLR